MVWSAVNDGIGLDTLRGAMEGMDDDVTESERVKHVTEGPPTKVTEIDRGLLIDRCNTLESQAEIASSEQEWPEELSSLRSILGQNTMGLFLGSPVGFGGALETKRQIFDTSKDETPSHSWSTLGRDFSLSNTEMMVEELTLTNYKGTKDASVGRCLNAAAVGACGVGQAESNRVHWQQLYQMVGKGNTNLHAQFISEERAAVELKVNLSSRQIYDDGEKEKLGDVRLCETRDRMAVSAQHPEQEREMAAQNMVHRDRYHHLSSPSPTQMLGREPHTRVPLPSSGFPEFFARNTSKGKGIAIKDVDPVKNSNAAVKPRDSGKASCNANIPADVSQSSAAFAGGSSLHFGHRVDHDSLEDGINLRKWLGPGSHKLGKPKRLLIFRQIVELVNLAHSQGVFIKELQPSSFIVSSDNQVKYIGPSTFHISPPCSARNNGSMNSSTDGSVKRKRQQQLFSSNQGDMKHESMSVGLLCSYGTPTLKHLKLNNGLRLSNRHDILSSQSWSKPESVADGTSNSSLVTHSRCGMRLHENGYEDHDAFTWFTHTELPDQPQQPSILSDKQLEETWYASPENISGKSCSSSSNTYSLGVLLFELFCCSESWEVHTASMSDLRHRILPPNFLAENPKEADFCLWMLHPEPSSRPKAWEVLQSDLLLESQDFSMEKHSVLSLDEEDAESDLLQHFLVNVKEQKHIEAFKLVDDIGRLEADIQEVERRQSLMRRNDIFHKVCKEDETRGGLSIQDENFTERLRLACEKKEHLPTDLENASWSQTTCSNKARILKNIKQLEDAYFSMRSKLKLSESGSAAREDREVLRNQDRCLLVSRNNAEVCKNSGKDDTHGAFFDGFCKYARYSRFEVRGILRNGDLLNSANVICSLSFDRDEEYFAAAGVSKKIKIFEFQSLLNDMVDIHYPSIEMSSRSKLSCVCWNSYIKNYIASTDYDGVVQLWDASTGQGFIQYGEHQKRAWSVDFSSTDPTKLASGSDDCSVKLWSINEKNCVGTIRNHANVCCVQFSPHSTHLLAFGSADYKVFCYDLRNIRVPWCTLAGHGKAVSYVKFLDSSTVISASTDNTLKLWDLSKTNYCGLSSNACSLTLSGHTNEKNFVGLSVADGYIACGSETNEVYAYYRSLPMPITSHKFGSIDPMSGQDACDDNGLFVSSVCWRRKSNMVVAANSNGNMKLLQLV